MKKNSIFGGAALMMAAFLAMIACNSIDVQVDVETVDAVKTIPYTVQVGAGDPSTRATVSGDYQTLHFAEGDKLYITGTNIKGVLNIQTGAGTANATFSGNLTYSGEGSPADNLALTATLVSEQQIAGEYVSVDEDNGAVTVNYPKYISDGYNKFPYCSSVNDAVQKYSRLTGTSTYGKKSFTLTQQTAFLNFEITLMDGTTAGTILDTQVKGTPSPSIYEPFAFYNYASVTTMTETESGKVVAKFVLPVASGITIDQITVALEENNHYDFQIYRKMTLEGKVYNVKRTFYSLSINSSKIKIGQVICYNGNNFSNYNYAERPKDVTPVAMICYYYKNHFNEAHGLALALTDESGTMDWNTAIITADEHTPLFSNHIGWGLVSEDEWKSMFKALNEDNQVYDSYNSFNLSSRFGSVGGTDLNGGYFSASRNGDYARYYIFWNSSVSNGGQWGDVLIAQSDLKVRACLYF